MNSNLLFSNQRKYKDIGRNKMFQKKQRQFKKQFQTHKLPNYEDKTGGKKYFDETNSQVVDQNFIKRLKNQIQHKKQSKTSQFKKNKFYFSSFKNIPINYQFYYKFSHYKHRRSTPYNYQNPQNTSVKINYNEMKKQFTKDQDMKDRINKVQVKNSQKNMNQTLKTTQSNPNEKINQLKATQKLRNQNNYKFSINNKGKEIDISCEMNLDKLSGEKKKVQQMQSNIAQKKQARDYYQRLQKTKPKNFKLTEYSTLNEEKYLQNDISEYQLEKIRKFENEQKSNPNDQQANEHHNSVNKGQRVMKKNHQNNDNPYKKIDQQMMKDITNLAKNPSKEEQIGQVKNTLTGGNKYRFSSGPSTNRQQTANKQHGQSSTANKQTRNQRKIPMDQNSGQVDHHRRSEKTKGYDRSYRQAKQKQIQYEKSKDNQDLKTATKPRIEQIREEKQHQQKQKRNQEGKNKHVESNYSQTNKPSYKFSHHKHSNSYNNNHPQNSEVNHSNNKNWQRKITQPNKVKDYDPEKLKYLFDPIKPPEQQFKEIPNTRSQMQIPKIQRVPPTFYENDVIQEWNK